MKKLTALILTLSMLLGMFAIPMGASAMTEDERQEILNSKEQMYININPNVDAFASLETIRNYANTNNAVNSSDAFNKVTEVYDETGTNVLYTYMNRLMNETHDGKPITGNETYYKKGIGSEAVDAVRISPMLYVTDSFKLSSAELASVAVKSFGLSSSSKTENPATIAAARYADPTRYASRTVGIAKADLNYLPTVVKTETVGDNYYVTIKDPETAAQFKLGPINDSEFVKNTLDVTKGTNGNNFAVVPEGTKGKTFSYVVATSNVNAGGSYANEYALNVSSPTAALSEVEITYADNYKETRYVLTTVNSGSSNIDDMVGLAIWTADKYDSEGNEIVYTADSFLKSTSTANPLTALTGTDLTLGDFIFPENVDANEINIAVNLRARQDTPNNNYGNKASFGTFELKDKEIKSINFIHDTKPADEEIEGIIGLYRTTSDGPRALIPVKLPEDKADANKVYFAYVGRFASSVALLGATVVGDSLQEKIDAVNAELAKAEEKEEIIAAFDEMKALIDANAEIVLAKDFVTTSAVDKLATYINADIEKATTVEEVEVIDTEIDGYVSAYGIDATTLKAAIAAKKAEFAATRLEGTVYAPIEMNFLNDLFATRAERGGTKDTLWFDGTKPYNAYVGYDSASTLLPMTKTKYSQGAVISVDGASTGIDKLATLVNGRYVLPIGGVPYRLGAMTEGVVDANAFEPGAMIANIEGNILYDRIDENFTLNNTPSASPTSYTVNTGKFSVDIPNTNKINVVTTTFVNTETTGVYNLYAVDALVHLDDGSYVGYVLLSAPAFKTDENVTSRTVEEAVVFVPKNSETDYSSYSAIKGAIGGEVKTLNDMPDYDLSDIKLPSAPTIKGPGVSRYNYVGLTGVRLGKDRNMYYDHVILPESTQEIYKDIGYKIKAYASSFELTAPEGRTITAVEFTHDGGGTLTKGTATECYTMAVGGVRSSDVTNAVAFIPATVEGLTDYQAYVRITRNCHHSAILGMTAEAKGTEVVASLNNLMANATASDIETIESMKAYIDGERLLYTDLDASARAKYEAIAEAANLAGTISLSEGNTVTAKINNITRLAGKKYTLIVAFYDEDENLIKAVPKQYLSEAAKEFSQTLTVENVPENTASVKGFIWKDFDTLIPLGTEAK